MIVSIYREELREAVRLHCKRGRVILYYLQEKNIHTHTHSYSNIHTNIQWGRSYKPYLKNKSKKKERRVKKQSQYNGNSKHLGRHFSKFTLSTKALSKR